MWPIGEAELPLVPLIYLSRSTSVSIMSSMGDPFDFLNEQKPVPSRRRQWSALQWLLGAAAGCIIGFAVVAGLMWCLLVSEVLPVESLKAVSIVVAASPIAGAILALWIMGAASQPQD
jgi:hypothetical protein